MLDGEKLSLALKTKGYQWFMKNKSKQDRIMKIGTKNKYMVSESAEFELGKVDALWAVATSAESDKSLKERAKERMTNRAVPMVDNFDDSMKIRRSCWILEERDKVNCMDT